MDESHQMITEQLVFCDLEIASCDNELHYHDKRFLLSYKEVTVIIMCMLYATKNVMDIQSLPMSI